MRGFVLMLALVLTGCGQNAAAPSAPKTAEIGVAVPTPPQPSAPQTLEDIDFSSYDTHLARFIGFERGESRIDAIDKVRLYFAPEDGSAIVKTSQQSFDRPDGSVLIFSIYELPDDSVRAQEVFLILTGPKEKQVLAEYGMKIKCYRGANTTEWQTQPCP